MIFTMIGGGAHRLLSTVRGALKEGAFRDGGELRYYDLDVSRSKVMAEMISKSPEFRGNPAPVKVKWDLTLEQALEGADVVSVTLLAGGSYTMQLCNELGYSYGFLGTDNVSYPGAFLALRGAPILMNIAKTMEKVCPNAILLDFANPVAVLSGMVNTFTKIRCYGICEGHNNHGVDYSRILFGKDSYDPDYDLYVAGINHCSFVCRGSYHGQDIFKLFRDRFSSTPDWLDRIVYDPNMTPTERAKKSCIFGNRICARLFQERDALMFSSEEDGFWHYCMEEALRYCAEISPFAGHDGELLSPDAMRKLAEAAEKGRQGRQAANERFAAYAALPADEIPWHDPSQHLFTVAAGGDVQCKVLLGVAGVADTHVAVSDLNDGSVTNLPIGVTCEYTHTVDKDGLHRVAGLFVPEGVLGMTTSLAVHQTLLAKACGTNDPHDLLKALLAYPIDSYTEAAHELWGKLLTASKGKIDPAFEGLRSLL